MRQRWIQACVVGTTIGIVAVIMQFLLHDGGFLANILAFLASACVVFLVQILFIHWFRE